MKTFIALFVASVLVDQALGHGAMQFPQPRNVYQSHYCPQCANGAGVCGAGGQWPADDSGSVQLNGQYTSSLTELVAGGMVEVEVYLTAVHQGHFALELCANPGSVITDDCFVKLQRDPSDTRFSPYASSAPWAAIFPENSCASSFSSSSPMKVRFIVPGGSISDHAILRWYWQSGNSCDSLPESSTDAPSEVRNWSASINGRTCRAAISQMGRLCGDECPNAQCTNEQFKNCADVRISSGDSNVIVTSSGRETGSGGSANGGGSSNNGGNSNTGGNSNNGGNSNSGGNSNNGGNSNHGGNSNGGNSNSGGNSNHGGNSNGGSSNGGNSSSSGRDWTNDIRKCKKDIEGRKSKWDELCQSYCDEIAVAGNPQQLWCLENGYNSLIKCVAKYYKSICEED